jgi:hypothetical protein
VKRYSGIKQLTIFMERGIGYKIAFIQFDSLATPACHPIVCMILEAI